MTEQSKVATPMIRCAVYTRKATTREFGREPNSLDAQRDAAETFIKSQEHEGWACLPDRYDDGGFSGATMDRPALKRLLADVDGGKVNCIVVHEIHRISRSLSDLARLMEKLDEKHVSLVSISPHLHIVNSTDWLMPNIPFKAGQKGGKD